MLAKYTKLFRMELSLKLRPWCWGGRTLTLCRVAHRDKALKHSRATRFFQDRTKFILKTDEYKLLAGQKFNLDSTLTTSYNFCEYRSWCKKIKVITTTVYVEWNSLIVRESLKSHVPKVVIFFMISNKIRKSGWEANRAQDLPLLWVNSLHPIKLEGKKINKPWVIVEVSGLLRYWQTGAWFV